jgi:hypothetical protein
MTHVLTLKTGKTTVEVHLLNPGEVFPNFGGSRHGLLVRKTASMVVRTRSPFDCRDVEYDIHDHGVWTWIADIVNREHAAFEAEAPAPVADKESVVK